MKKSALSICFLLLASGFVSGLADPSAAVKKEIDLFLTAWHRAAAEADAATYFDSLAAGAIFLGTDLRERWEKEDFQKWAMPYFKPPAAWVFSASRRHIYLSADGRTAWFDEDLVSRSYWPCRGSGVLEKIAGQWRIRQYNLAFTIPNEASKEIKLSVQAAFARQSAAETQSVLK